MKISEVMQEIKSVNPALAAKLESQGYCLVEGDNKALICINRFLKVLVKCGNGRFTCPVQDLDHFLKVIGQSKEEYVRSVEIAISD